MPPSLTPKALHNKAQGRRRRTLGHEQQDFQSLDNPDFLVEPRMTHSIQIEEGTP